MVLKELKFNATQQQDTAELLINIFRRMVAHNMLDEHIGTSTYKMNECGHVSEI